MLNSSYIVGTLEHLTRNISCSVDIQKTVGQRAGALVGLEIFRLQSPHRGRTDQFSNIFIFSKHFFQFLGDCL